MLNQIIAALGPTVASGLAGGVAGWRHGRGSAQVTAAQASQLSPQQVQDVVQSAHQGESRHRRRTGQLLLTALGPHQDTGWCALAIAMTKIKDNMTNAEGEGA